MSFLIDLILHLPEHLLSFTQHHGVWVYALLFVIIFCETGLVVLPFLPGDSLIFAVGALAANTESGLNFWVAAILLIIAAIIGDSLNYWIGKRCSQYLIQKFPRFIKQAHIDKTQKFYEQYGGKTIILARFVPIVRTFAPFVAGSSQMNYANFMRFNVIGAMLWVGLILPAGYFFGGLDFVKKNFELIVLAIIFISILPMFIEILRAKMTQNKK